MQVSETVIVKVGVLGSADEAVGTQTVTLQVSDEGTLEDAAAVGAAIGDGYRAAYMEAMLAFRPKMGAHWKAARERQENGED